MHFGGDFDGDDGFTIFDRHVGVIESIDWSFCVHLDELAVVFLCHGCLSGCLIFVFLVYHTSIVIVHQIYVHPKCSSWRLI